MKGKTERNKDSNSVEQNPSWEACSHSASPEIRRLLWNPKVQYRVHNSPPLVHMLSQMHSIHTFSSCFSKFITNIYEI